MNIQLEFSTISQQNWPIFKNLGISAGMSLQYLSGAIFGGYIDLCSLNLCLKKIYIIYIDILNLQIVTCNLHCKAWKQFKPQKAYNTLPGITDCAF